MLDWIVNFATDVIGAMGVWGVFVLMVLESACIPVPSEAIMLFAGFNVAEGKLSLVGIVVAGVAGNVVGSWIAYAVGYAGRIELLEKHGKWLHISRKHLDTADRWFERWGAWAVFFSRMLPIVRTFISLPAGAARMPFWRFTLLTVVGCIPWVLMLGLVGQAVGGHWEQWRGYLHYFDYAVAGLIVAAVAYFVVRHFRRRRDGSSVNVENAESGTVAPVATSEASPEPARSRR